METARLNKIANRIINDSANFSTEQALHAGYVRRGIAITKAHGDEPSQTLVEGIAKMYSFLASLAKTKAEVEVEELEAELEHARKLYGQSCLACWEITQLSDRVDAARAKLRG